VNELILVLAFFLGLKVPVFYILSTCTRCTELDLKYSLGC
jgi:hypothetical protein